MEETLTEHGRGCVTDILDNNIMVKTTLRVLRISRYMFKKKNVLLAVPTTALDLRDPWKLGCRAYTLNREKGGQAFFQYLTLCHLNLVQTNDL